MQIKEPPKYTNPSVNYATPVFDMGIGSSVGGSIFWHQVFPPTNAPAGFYVRLFDEMSKTTHVVGPFQSFSAAWASNADSPSFTKAVIEKKEDGSFSYAKSPNA